MQLTNAQGIEMRSDQSFTYKPTRAIDVQDIELLEKVWGTVAEWHQLYNGWKDGRFGDLKVEEMEEAAGRVAKALQRLGREIKHWPAWAWIKVMQPQVHS